MEQELEQAVKLCARSRQAVMEMFNDARMGQALQFEQAAALVEEISESVLRHPNADQPGAAQAQNEYTYMHSVAVCALMIALARKLGLPDDAAGRGWPGCCMTSARWSRRSWRRPASWPTPVR